VIVRAAALALAVVATGCAQRAQPQMLERIAGTTRVRHFASPTAYEAFLHAEFYAARGTAEGRAEARRRLGLAALADPHDPWLVVRQVALYLDDGDLPGARVRADEATRSFPESAAAWLCSAEVARRGGDEARAFREGQRALGLDPDDPDVRAAVAALADAPPAAVAHARRSAPQADDGDRVTADRVYLDPVERIRRTARTRLRLEAGRLRARSQWAEVDRTLSAAARLDPTDSVDRLTVIEARVRDGRPRDAAPWVAALRVGSQPGQVSAARRARLWLLVRRPDLAEEEADAALRAQPDDQLAQRVRAEAWCALGRVGPCVAALSTVPLDAEDDPLAESWEAPWAGRPDLGRGPGMAFAQARIVAVRALERVGLVDEADRAVAAALVRLNAPEMAFARDALRVAWAHTLATHRPERPRSPLLDAVETRWGIHRRGALRARDADPAPALNDLRVRADEAHEDALADAWRALVCARPDAAPLCEPGEADAARTRAARDAPAAPVTLRARARAADLDPETARALLLQADRRDPLSPWRDTAR
jgi:tetratricopeptide (TPR) repeat protein